MHDPTPAVLPGSQSKTAPSNTPSPPGAVAPSPPLLVSEKTVPPPNIPLTPPSPGGKTQISIPSAKPPPDSSSSGQQPPKPFKRKPRRFLRFLGWLIGFSFLGFGGGVWYSLRSDNFHDFFTEYIPFGEDTVLYFEEREFRRRFPKTLGSSRPPSGETQRVTIPSNSGLTSKERDIGKGRSDLDAKGPHMSAIEAIKPNGGAQATNKPVKESHPPKQDTARGSPPAKDQSKAAPSSDKPSEIPLKPTGDKSNTSSFNVPAVSKTHASNTEAPKIPEVDEPNVFLPMARIDPLPIKEADEPLVQDLVRMLNDIIAVVNTDNVTSKFNSSINKAKQELSAVGQKMLELKAAQQTAADERIKATEANFDKSAQELVRKLELHLLEQEGQWRDEFESERQKIVSIYNERYESELEKNQQISDQRIRNQLLEQSVVLKKEFASAIQDRVETERQGRLARLADLSSNINELEELTKQWNSVLDANIKTQHLQVAVEAVRSGLEKADRPYPFVRELAALKELAAENPVVDSAIASINPSAYQLGVATSAQLIDRFRRVAGEVRKASLLPEDAGVASHAASFLLSKMMFKKQGRAVGDDVESILTRAETLLEEGNLDEAAREVNTLHGWAKTLSKDWLGEIRKVLEVRQALDVSQIFER